MRSLALIPALIFWLASQMYAQSDTTKALQHTLPEVLIEYYKPFEPFKGMAQNISGYDKIKELITTDLSTHPTFTGSTRFTRNGLDNRKLPVVLYVGDLKSPFVISNPLESLQSVASTLGNWDVEIYPISNQPGVGVVGINLDYEKKRQLSLSPFQQSFDFNNESYGLYAMHSGTSWLEGLIEELSVFPEEGNVNGFMHLGSDVKLDLIVRGLIASNSLVDDEDNISQLDRLDEERAEALGIVNLSIPMGDKRVAFGGQAEIFDARTETVDGDKREHIKGATRHYMGQAMMGDRQWHLGFGMDYLHNIADFHSLKGSYGDHKIKRVWKAFGSVNIPYGDGVVTITGDLVHDGKTFVPIGISASHYFDVLGIPAIAFGAVGTHYNALRTNNTIVYDIVSVERLDNHRGEQALASLRLKLLGGELALEGYYTFLRYDRSGNLQSYGGNFAFSNDNLLFKLNAGHSERETEYGTLPNPETSDLNFMIAGRIPLGDFELFGQMTYTAGIHIPIRNDGHYEYHDDVSRWIKMEDKFVEINKNVLNLVIGANYKTLLFGFPTDINLSVMNLDPTFKGRHLGVASYRADEGIHTQEIDIPYPNLSVMVDLSPNP